MTEEQRKLVAKARRAIRSARLLTADKDYDAAVSRAYYAMFYLVEAMLLSKGLAFSKHSAVASAFGKEFTKTGAVPAEYHRYLIDAQEARNLSDYEAVSQVTEETSRLHLSRAELFLELVDETLR